MCIIPTYFSTVEDQGKNINPYPGNPRSGRNAGGNEQQGLLLLSGGIDNPVAGYRRLRRRGDDRNHLLPMLRHA